MDLVWGVSLLNHCRLCRITLAQPVFKLLDRHSLDRPKPLPPRFVVSQIAFPSGLLIGKPQHGFMLIKLARFGVYLIDYIDHVTSMLITNKHIDVITICTFGTFDVAIVMRHGGLPSFTILISTASD